MSHLFVGWPASGLPDFDAFTTRLAAIGSLPPRNSTCVWAGSLLNRQRKQCARTMQERTDLFSVFIASNRPPYRFLPLLRQAEDHGCFVDVAGGHAGGGYSGRVPLLMHSRRPIIYLSREVGAYYERYIEPWRHYIPADRHNLSGAAEWIARPSSPAGGEACASRLRLGVTAIGSAPGGGGRHRRAGLRGVNDRRTARRHAGQARLQSPSLQGRDEALHAGGGGARAAAAARAEVRDCWARAQRKSELRGDMRERAHTRHIHDTHPHLRSRSTPSSLTSVVRRCHKT